MSSFSNVLRCKLFLWQNFFRFSPTFFPPHENEVNFGSNGLTCFNLCTASKALQTKKDLFFFLFHFLLSLCSFCFLLLIKRGEREREREREIDQTYAIQLYIHWMRQLVIGKSGKIGINNLLIAVYFVRRPNLYS